jgi:hypothetical protein
VTGLPALARDLALLRRIHRREAALGSSASVRCHVDSPDALLDRWENAVGSAEFTMLIDVSDGGFPTPLD